MASPPSTPNSSASTSSAVDTPQTKPIQLLAALNPIQSIEHLEILDEIDNLRAHYLNFSPHPKLAVFGDRSSGKTSVIEAITGLQFPEGVTRFPIEIVFKRGREPNTSVSIIPDSSRPEKEQNRLQELSKNGHLSFKSLNKFPQLVTLAGQSIGVSPKNESFFADILVVTITDPSGPQFSIIDLPPSEESYEGIKHLQQKRSLDDTNTIILAVVSAEKEHMSLHRPYPSLALEAIKGWDQKGERTLGIITKPDTLPSYSDQEWNILQLIRNENIHLKLGWHVLMNGHDRSTHHKRDDQEKLFFEMNTWKDLPREMLGADQLRSRLGSLMYSHIKKDLFMIYESIVGRFEDCEAQLRKIGKQRSTTTEKKELLSEFGSEFSRLCKDALYGVYGDKFFENAINPEGKLRQLRTVIQNNNISFAERMKTHGHSKQILDKEDGHESQDKPFAPEHITRNEAITDWVKPLLINSHSYKITAPHSSPVISKLFEQQSKPWETLAQSHLDTTWKICRKFLQILFQHIIPQAEIVDSLFSHFVDDKMQDKFNNASNELKRLLAERCFDTIYLKDEFFEKMKADNMKRRLEKKSLFSRDIDYNLYEEILDRVGAFYKTSMDVFIHNVVVQVIERHIVSGLWEILSPSSVACMTESLVSDIVEEPAENQYLRNRLEEKKKNLQATLEVWRDILWGRKGNTSITDSKGHSYFTSFMNPEDLTSFFDDMDLSTPTKNVPKTENQQVAETAPTKPPHGGSPPNTSSTNTAGPPSSGFSNPSSAAISNPVRNPSIFANTASGGKPLISSEVKHTLLVKPYPYKPWLVKDNYCGELFVDISTMPSYRRFSREEIRLQDYQNGNRYSGL